MIEQLHTAAADCENVRSIVGQPVNVLSSLAMSGLGIWLLWQARHWHDRTRKRSLLAVGIALVSTGIGSAAFHGPGGWIAHVLHDVTITALPLAAAVALEAERRAIDSTRWFGALMAMTVLTRMITPDAHIPATALAFGWLGFAIYKRRSELPLRRGWLGAAALTLIAARVFFELSRTGEVLCRPDSVLQGHAAWHILVAVSVVLTAKALSLLPDATGPATTGGRTSLAPRRP